jgi:hypothetical protein
MAVMMGGRIREKMVAGEYSFIMRHPPKTILKIG